MKKTVSVILLLTLLLSLASCGGDGYQTVKEGNVSLRIPDTMIKRNVSYADIYYSNGEMYLMMMAFSNFLIKLAGITNSQPASTIYSTPAAFNSSAT